MLSGVAGTSRKNVGFVGAFLSLAAIYGASSAPIPLYDLYSQRLSLSNADLSLSSGLYFIGTLVALLFMARLSDYRGRRPISLLTLALSGIGCGTFLTLSSEEMFIGGRFLQGVSCGLGSSSLAAYLVDTVGQKSGAAAVASAPMVGLAAGSFGSGLLLEYGSGSSSTVFALLLILLGICAVLILASEETMPSKTGAIRSLKPQISLPQNIRPFLPAAIAVFVGTWGIGGFYQAFSAPIATGYLSADNAVVAAAVFACLQAPNIIGSMAARKMETQRAQKIGMTLFLLSVCAVIYTLLSGMTVMFLLASACTGASWGLAYTGSLQGMVSRTGQSERAGVLSAACLISYGGAAIPSLIVGRLGTGFTLDEIAIGYGVLALLTWAMACLFSHNEENAGLVMPTMKQSV